MKKRFAHFALPKMNPMSLAAMVNEHEIIRQQQFKEVLIRINRLENENLDLKIHLMDMQNQNDKLIRKNITLLNALQSLSRYLSK